MVIKYYGTSNRLKIWVREKHNINIINIKNFQSIRDIHVSCCQVGPWRPHSSALTNQRVEFSKILSDWPWRTHAVKWSARQITWFNDSPVLNYTGTKNRAKFLILVLRHFLGCQICNFDEIITLIIPNYVNSWRPVFVNSYNITYNRKTICAYQIKHRITAILFEQKIALFIPDNSAVYK